MFSPSSIISGGLGSWGDASSVVTLGYGIGADVPVIDLIDTTGQGNWYRSKPKFKIKLVQKLTKELEVLVKKKEKTATRKEQEEIIIYEALLYEELVKEYDDSVKNLISRIDARKTEIILNKIKSDIEMKKKAMQIEEEEIMFAFMSLM